MASKRVIDKHPKLNLDRIKKKFVQQPLQLEDTVARKVLSLSIRGMTKFANVIIDVIENCPDGNAKDLLPLLYALICVHGVVVRLSGGSCLHYVVPIYINGEKCYVEWNAEYRRFLFWPREYLVKASKDDALKFYKSRGL